MSRCEDFDNSFWDDDVLERLTAYPTLLYIWSWTNPRCGMAGLYKVRRSTMTESKVPAEDIPAALDALAADGRDPVEIERIIRWCQADGFWQRNILSAPKLREKFTQLVAAAGQQGPGLRPVVGGKYDAAAAAKANRGEAA